MSRLVVAPLVLLPLLVGCAAPAPALELHRFTSGPEGFDTNSWWVDTGAEVVVFDAQFTPALAQALLDEITAQTQSPVTTVVLTHPNPDKFNGASVFQAAGAELVASEDTLAAMGEVHAYKQAYFVGAGMFAEGEYPALPEVDRTFTDTLTLDTAAPIVLEVLEHSGVTLTQTVARVGDEALVVGDLAAGGAHLWLEGAIVDGMPAPDLESWALALDEVAALGGTVYPGRGQPEAAQTLVPAHQDYLEGMDTLVGEYVAALEDPGTALSGPDAGSHYAALTAEAEAAWPELELSYLVTYGVYGLALQKIE